MPDEMAGVLEKLGRHDQALDNGRHEFEKIHVDITAIKGSVKALEPKSPDWLKVSAFILSLVVVILGAWWKLNGMFNERPTKSELSHDRTEQQLLMEQQGKDIGAIHDRQIEQSKDLQQLQSAADKTNQRLDQLLSDKGKNGP